MAARLRSFHQTNLTGLFRPVRFIDLLSLFKPVRSGFFMIDEGDEVSGEPDPRDHTGPKACML